VRLFVTGGGGLLGRHLGRRAAGEHEVVAPTSAELDVRDGEAVLRAVREVRPDAVIHLAYRRDDRPTNVDGSSNVAGAAADVGARLVHLSTDVVFGDHATPRVESDLPDPVHDYGRAKAAAESEVLSAAPAAVVVRTSLLYGDRDLAQIQRDVVEAVEGRSAMRFFTDEVRCPVHAGDVAAALLRLAGDLAAVHGPLHVGGPDALSRAELARRFARHLGLDERSVPTASAVELGADRSRPLRVVLDSTRATSLGLAVRPVAVALEPE
jgi:dTDP-4-dehydrorhamnose reductase